MTAGLRRRSVCSVDRLRTWLDGRRVLPLRRPGGFALDVVICAVLIAYAIPATTDPSVNGPDTPLDTLFMPAAALPMLLRRRAPFAAACAMAAGCVISGIPSFDQIRLIVAVPAALFVVFSLASRTERSRAFAGLGLVLAGMAFVGATDAALRDQGGAVGLLLFFTPLCGVVFAAGRIARSRQLVADELQQRSRELAFQREQTATLAVEVERIRLVTDLDTAARVPVGTMIALAASGERVLDGDPVAAHELFARIEGLGRDALNEMRGLLGVLRSDERGARSPRPTLAQIDTLLARARAGGRVVDLEVKGERRPLGAAVELAAYRAVQHALAALRDGEGQPCSVQLRYVPGALELEVRGLAADGSGPAAALVAAQERVTAHGGTFSADSPAAGQRVLRAWIPAVAVRA